MSFTIREFDPADFETLWRIDQDCFAPGISYTKPELKYYIRNVGSFTLVAVEAAQAATAGAHSRKSNQRPPITLPNAVAGFIVTEVERGSGHIITIDVVASVRRFGVGSLLLSGAEARLRAVQCRVVVLETAVNNVSALSFYKRHGYHVVGTSPRYYSNGVDALMLEKNLE